MQYSELIDELQLHREEAFANFQRKLIFTSQTILGVRTPTLRKIAKKYRGDIQTLFSFPDEFYEVAFIKLTAVSALPYEQLLLWIDKCVALMDNWATCDSFKCNCIKAHKDAFLPVIERIFQRGGEYEQRYPLVVLLSYYAEERYIPVIKRFLAGADTSRYYVSMAAAWLTTEILIKRFNDGVEILKSGILDTKTHDKAIQKAIESYRINIEKKELLRSLKINKVR